MSRFSMFRRVSIFALCLLPVFVQAANPSLRSNPSSKTDFQKKEEAEARKHEELRKKTERLKKEFASVDAKFSTLGKTWASFSHKEFATDKDKDEIASLGKRQRQIRHQAESAFSSDTTFEFQQQLVSSYKSLFGQMEAKIEQTLKAARKARASEANEAFGELLRQYPASLGYAFDESEPGHLVFAYRDPSTDDGKRYRIRQGITRVASKFDQLRVKYMTPPSDEETDLAETFYVELTSAETLDDKVAVVYKHFPDLDPNHKQPPEPEKQPRKFGVPKETKTPESSH